MDWLPFLLQASDPLFPTGAYAHSLGFEEIVRLEVVHDEVSLAVFLHEQIIPQQRACELPYLRFAWEAAGRNDLHTLAVLDGEISAWKLARETREASLQIGGRRLQALRTIREAPLLEAVEMAMVRQEMRGHHLTICGVQAAIEKLPLEAALAAWNYQALAGVCAAALKLMRIGQGGCQRALRSALDLAPDTIARSLKISRGEAGWFSPLLEIASMRHERAGERLFIS